MAASPAYGDTLHTSYVILEPVPQYSDFLDRAQLLTQKLPNQGYGAPRMKSSLLKLYDGHHNLVDRYEISTSQMTMNRFLFMENFRAVVFVTMFGSVR